jgi:mono/diheme cytochrome c family protein
MKISPRAFVWAAAGMMLALVGTSSAQEGAQKDKEKARFKLGPVTGNAANGKKLFYAHTCYGCHGFNGETGVRDLVGTNSPIIANEDTFILFLRQRADRAPITPSTGMPNFPENALPNKDAKDIYAYIRSFKLDAPKVQDVPTLKKILDSADKPYKP